jgi:hypothetical protein
MALPADASPTSTRQSQSSRRISSLCSSDSMSLLSLNQRRIAMLRSLFPKSAPKPPPSVFCFCWFRMLRRTDLFAFAFRCGWSKFVWPICTMDGYVVDQLVCPFAGTAQVRSHLEYSIGQITSSVGFAELVSKVHSHNHDCGNDGDSGAKSTQAHRLHACVLYFTPRGSSHAKVITTALHKYIKFRMF